MVYFILFGVVLLLGLRVSWGLSRAVSSARRSKCQRLQHQPQAFLWKLPISQWAFAMYCICLAMWLQVLIYESLEERILWLPVSIMLIASGYYAYLSFSLREWCYQCSLLHVVNIILALFLYGTHTSM